MDKSVLLIVFTMQYMLPFLSSHFVTPIVLSLFILITYFEFQLLTNYICRGLRDSFIV